jgi:hypothetical protein
VIKSIQVEHCHGGLRSARNDRSNISHDFG